QKVVEFALKCTVRFRQFVGPLQLEQRHHQRFGNVAATVGAKATRRRGRRLQKRAHTFSDFSARTSNSLSARRTSRMKSRSLPWSFFPGLDSTPLATSTA